MISYTDIGNFGITLASYTDGIYNFNIPYVNMATGAPDILFNKKIPKSVKACFEDIQNTRSGGHPLYFGSLYWDEYNRYGLRTAAIGTGSEFFHYFNNISNTYSTSDQSKGSDPGTGTVVGWCYDPIKRKSYRYHNGVLAYTYDLSEKANLFIPESYFQYYKIQISNCDAAGSLSVNLGEKGLKYSYPGFTSVYDAAEYDSELDKLKIKSY
jgi:hypothetical protein